MHLICKLPTCFVCQACPSILRHFSSHRLRTDAFTTALNFGSIEVKWGNKESSSSSSSTSTSTRTSSSSTRTSSSSSIAKTAAPKVTVRLHGVKAVAEVEAEEADKKEVKTGTEVETVLLSHSFVADEHYTQAIVELLTEEVGDSESGSGSNQRPDMRTCTTAPETPAETTAHLGSDDATETETKTRETEVDRSQFNRRFNIFLQ